MFKYVILFTILLSLVANNLPDVTDLANEYAINQYLVIVQISPNSLRMIYSRGVGLK